MNTNFSRPTLEDISNEIHISRTTIYKVLNHKGNVSDKTRELVLNALEKYHYVPNNNARNLALNKQYTIALVDFESRDAAYFASSIERGIKQAISDFGDHGLCVQCYTAPANRPDRQAADIQTALCRILHQEDRRQLTLVGMDLFPEIRPYIADRTIDAIIFQNLEAQTHLACRLLFEKMCYGREITQDKYYSKLEIVMSGNLEYFL